MFPERKKDTLLGVRRAPVGKLNRPGAGDVLSGMPNGGTAGDNRPRWRPLTISDDELDLGLTLLAEAATRTAR